MHPSLFYTTSKFAGCDKMGDKRHPKIGALLYPYGLKLHSNAFKEKFIHIEFLYEIGAV